jgi:7-carboxy-7-deazaguanine synthase
VERKADFDEIRHVLDNLKNVDPARVLVMAQGTKKRQLSEKAKWIVELCKENGYGFTPRLQIELFGNRRGT